jgi:CTP:molybdopterin cytidylyltransferase MocA
MKRRLDPWALVLAGGEGSRLRSLTQNDEGVAVPKQFCSLQGGPSLLAAALNRAGAIAPRERLCAIVAGQHRQWWADGTLDDLPDSNVFVQPSNRGTAHGVLLPLVKIAARDPNAIVVLLPADHYFRNEATIAASLSRATVLATVFRGRARRLGAFPRCAKHDSPRGSLMGEYMRRQSRAEEPLSFSHPPALIFAKLAAYELEGGRLCFDDGLLKPCSEEQHDATAVLDRMTRWLANQPSDVGQNGP